MPAEANPLTTRPIFATGTCSISILDLALRIGCVGGPSRRTLLFESSSNQSNAVPVYWWQYHDCLIECQEVGYMESTEVENA